MLETLLKHLRTYGMDDLEFIIVNSKLSHSQEKLEELEKRVTFPVYQETNEEEVWSVLEGGKDDMYVYDRCGRLTYYVPFPLSILTESPAVSNAILATYFRNPCGVTCEKNETDIEEIARNLGSNLENSTDTTEAFTYGITEESSTGNETTNISSNNLLDIIDIENGIDVVNTSDAVNATDIDFSASNETEKNEYNNTTSNSLSEYYNALYRLFFPSAYKPRYLENSNATVSANETFTNLMNETTVNINSESKIRNDSLNHTHHSHHNHTHKAVNKTEEIKAKMKSDRCAEADYEVCKSWNQKRLLHAQKCCSGIQTNTEFRIRKSCHNFGKRRCKKIQSILKCCITTDYTETTESPTTTEEVREVTSIPIVVCCKTTAGEKICRVPESGSCDEDEHVEDSPQKSM